MTKERALKLLNNLIQQLKDDKIEVFDYIQDFPCTPLYNQFGEVEEFSRKGCSITTKINIVDKARTK